MAAGGQLGAVENAACGAVAVDHAASVWRTQWQEREHHQVSKDSGGRSGSATRARRDHGSRSRGTNSVVVEPASVEAIASDELGWGASSGAPVCTTMGGGGAELTQPHRLRKAATARRAGSQRNRSAVANGGVHALAISDAVQRGCAVVEK
jgi:hypothetical protein